MLFRSLFSGNAKKACTGTGSGGVCYIVGRKYYNSNGKLVRVY